MIPLGVMASARVAPSTPTRLLAAHWAMDEGAGTVATDSVNGIVATLPGASSRWVAGIDGTAVQIDPKATLFAVTSWPTHTWDRLTVEWRMRLDSGSGDAMVFTENSSGRDILGLWVSSTKVKVWCYMGGSLVGNVETALTTTLGTWHDWRIDVTLTSGLELWRDGVLIVSYPSNGRAYIGRAANPTGRAYIVGSPWANTPGQTVDDWKLLGPTL